MISKRAEKFIEEISCMYEENIGQVDYEGAIKAVELAEAEMKEKAIEVHRNCCKYFIDNDCYLGCTSVNSNIPICDKDCDYMEEFIDQLNQ